MIGCDHYMPFVLWICKQTIMAPNIPVKITRAWLIQAVSKFLVHLYGVIGNPPERPPHFSLVALQLVYLTKALILVRHWQDWVWSVCMLPLVGTLNLILLPQERKLENQPLLITRYPLCKEITSTSGIVSKIVDCFGLWWNNCCSKHHRDFSLWANWTDW